MTPTRRRWALSFADLCLLLLGFVLILHARPDPATLAASLRGAMRKEALPVATSSADRLFEPGEALLTTRGRDFAADFARRSGGRSVAVESQGIARGSDRLDAWELSAARAAALGRALVAEGVPATRVTLSVEGAPAPGQRLMLRAH